MITAGMKPLGALFGAIMLLNGAPERAAAAQSSSPWVVNEYTRSRLLIGGYDAGRQVLKLGWQVKLKDGWKTYWRTPGDAGLPPRWSWEQHENIAEISVKWPAPEKIYLFDMETYIYREEVVLPIEIRVRDATRPVSLALAMDYMICAEICVPLGGRYDLVLPSLEGLDVSPYRQALLRRFEALVPRRMPGDGISVAVAPDRENILRMTLPGAYAGYQDIVVEGPDGTLFGPPVAVARESGVFEVAFRSDQSMEGRELTLTFLSGEGRAREVTATVSSPLRHSGEGQNPF